MKKQYKSSDFAPKITKKNALWEYPVTYDA